jgi:hypothetical protein
MRKGDAIMPGNRCAVSACLHFTGRSPVDHFTLHAFSCYLDSHSYRTSGRYPKTKHASFFFCFILDEVDVKGQNLYVRGAPLYRFLIVLPS